MQLERPDQEEVDATMKETQAALDQLVSGKVMSQQPKTLPQQPGAPTYLKYKPLHSGPQHNSGAEHRIIKMQDMPVDPMEPPKFRHKKVRRPPGLPGAPTAICIRGRCSFCRCAADPACFPSACGAADALSLRQQDVLLCLHLLDDYVHDQSSM